MGYLFNIFLQYSTFWKKCILRKKYFVVSGFEPCMYYKIQSFKKTNKKSILQQYILLSYFASFRIQTLYHEIQFTFSYFCHNQDLNSELFVLFRSKFKLNLEAFSDLSTRRLFTEDRHANGFFFILSLRFRGPLRFFSWVEK